MTWIRHLARSGFPITLQLLCVSGQKLGQKWSKRSLSGHFLDIPGIPVFSGFSREHAKRGGVWPGICQKGAKSG